MKKNKKVNPELATAVANMMKNDELKTLADLNGFYRLNKESLNAQVDFWNRYYW